MRAQPIFRFASPGRLFLLAFVLTGLAMTSPPGTAAPLPLELRQAFAQSAQVDYLFVLKDNVNLDGASQIADVKARRQWVYQRLRDQALRSQSAARVILDTAAATYRSHYLLNALEVHSSQAVAEQLAALPGANHLYEVRPIRAALPVLDATDTERRSPQSPSTIEWNVERVHAPEVWSTFGTRGAGIVVGTADTGVQWDHPALQPHYRGWDGSTASHSYNWHDAIHDGFTPRCPQDSTVPCDGYQPTHGTHVTGTMIGDDGAGNQIGVAPGAQWIGCRNMDDNGDGTIARYTECFEFMLAPYPFGGDPLADGRPDLAADVVNNSWTCPASEGCDSLHQNDMASEVQKLNTAGILVVAAAGNSGSGCGSVNRPIATYAETFAVGATDGSDNIASFSSRGPVTVDGSNRRKPDVSAPGVNVRSTLSETGVLTYGYLSGTSMASPHVSAVTALVWSAIPALRGDVARTKTLLENSALHMTTEEGCGGDTNTDVPNNTFGYGLVDAAKAIATAGLRLTKAAAAQATEPPNTLTYVLSVTNIISASVAGVVVTDHVPSGSTYLPGSIGGPGADDSLAPHLRWNLPNVPTPTLSSTLTLSFTVRFDVAAGQNISNTAYISSTYGSPVPSNLVTSIAPYLGWLPSVMR